jgi:hypothetical protein
MSTVSLLRKTDELQHVQKARSVGCHAAANQQSQSNFRGSL